MATVFWGHARRPHADRFEGAFASREAAIRDGRATYGADVFWIQAGTAPSWDSLLPDADEVLDWLANRAYDLAGESASEFPEVTAEARTELEVLLLTWARKHVEVSFWIGTGEPERIDGRLARSRA